MLKKPWLAALLNAWPLPLGVGYLYLKRWGRFVLSFLVLQIGAITVVLMLFRSDLLLDLFTAGIWIAVIVDGYLVARRMNKALVATAET
ncbi:MAG: hypothetical protein GTO63_18810 [Anaerolineae bacterium]|nr:hypothetical protein [Anaerolineae bacterium]NIN96824.1 hypothetical protein [Anaerolineae bacterium]NIQ79808.1 hypothetical protein [Anaerolineae bacterium]